MFKKMSGNITGKYILGFAVIFIAALILGNSLTVKAYDPTTEIEVTVGFWGEEKYSKGKVTKEELAAKYGVHSEIYTWIDKRPSAGTTEAKGFYVADILAHFGINRSYVDSYNFLSLDGWGVNANFKEQELFGTSYTFVQSYKRIVDDYLPYAGRLDAYIADSSCYRLSNFYNMADNIEVPSYTQDAWNSRQEIAPMLAFSKYNARWDATYPTSLLDYSQIAEKDGFTVFQGQKSVDDQARANNGKMIYEIAVWYKKVINITQNTETLEGEVGDTAEITFAVSTPDETLTRAIYNQLEWKVNDNEGIVSVSKDGKVTFNKVGTTSISLYYKNGSESNIKVTVTEKVKEQETETDPPEDESESGTGGGSGGGTGTGIGTGTGSGTGGLINYFANADLFFASSNSDGSSANPGGGGEGGTVHKEPETVQAFNSANKNWKIFEMSEPLEEFTDIKSDNPIAKMIPYIVITLFILGGIEEGVRFYLQVKIRRSKLKLKEQ